MTIYFLMPKTCRDRGEGSGQITLEPNNMIKLANYCVDTNTKTFLPENPSRQVEFETQILFLAFRGERNKQ